MGLVFNMMLVLFVLAFAYLSFHFTFGQRSVTNNTLILNLTSDKLNQTNSSSGVISGFNRTLESQNAICVDANTNGVCFNEVHGLDSIVI
jgi:hypothetical protein